jgi:hypothetical protein
MQLILGYFSTSTPAYSYTLITPHYFFVAEAQNYPFIFWITPQVPAYAHR